MGYLNVKMDKRYSLSSSTESCGRRWSSPPRAGLVKLVSTTSITSTLSPEAILHRQGETWTHSKRQFRSLTLPAFLAQEIRMIFLCNEVSVCPIDVPPEFLVHFFTLANSKICHSFGPPNPGNEQLAPVYWPDAILQSSAWHLLVKFGNIHY